MVVGEREWEMGREEEGRERKRGRWMEGGEGGRSFGMLLTGT